MTTVSPHIPTRTLDGNNIPNFPYPIRRLLCATHPAAVDTPHPAFQPYPHHIASFKIVFDDSQRNKRNGAKPFRMCFAVETEGQTTTIVDESRVISIDTKVYAHKAFSNAYTSYKKGRFGVTMLSNDISYVVHGYVKAIPKDVVMMYVATPEDVQSNSMNKHPSMHPSYALSVGATYTVSFFATHAARKSRIRYVDTVSDADSSLVVLVTSREREADNTLFQTCPCHEDTSQPIPLHYSPETTQTHLSTPIKQEHAFDITKFVPLKQQQQQDTLPFTIHPAPTSQLPVHTTPPTTTSHLSTPPATTSHLSMHPHHKRHLSITTTTQTSRSAPSSPTGTSPYNSSSPWSSSHSTVTVSPAQALAQSVSALSLREGTWDAMNVSHSPPIIHPDPTADEPLHHLRQRVRTGIKQHSSHLPISPSAINDSPGNPNKGRRLSTPTLFSNAHHPHHALIPSSRSRTSRSPSRTSSKSAPSTPQVTQRTLSSLTHYSDHLTPPMNDIDTPITDTSTYYESSSIPLTIPIPQTEATYDTTTTSTYDTTSSSTYVDTTIPTTHSSYDTTSAAAYQSHMDTSTPHHSTSTIPDMSMPRLPSLPTDIRLPSLPTDALSPSTLSTFTSPSHFNYRPHHSRLPSSIEMSMSQVASLTTPKHTRIPSYDLNTTPKHTRIPSYDLNTTPKHTRIPSYPVMDLSSPMASSAAARVTSPTSLLAGSAATTMGVNAVTSIDESSHHHIRTLSSQLLDSFSPFLTSPSPHHTLGKSVDFTDPVWSNMISRLNEEEIPPLQSMGQV